MRAEQQAVLMDVCVLALFSNSLQAVHFNFAGAGPSGRLRISGRVPLYLLRTACLGGNLVSKKSRAVSRLINKGLLTKKVSNGRSVRPSADPSTAIHLSSKQLVTVVRRERLMSPFSQHPSH
jgi:hypothetical protein